jgi:hypothetical protein
MYQIGRIHLSSVGPEGARFDPLTLDLTRSDGTIAMDTILWLENGGGKTVLLRLLFAVLRPDQVASFGTEDTGRIKGLPAFLLADDTAHVIVEWRHIDPKSRRIGDVTVTGLVAEWRGRTRSSDSGNLIRTWYSLRGPEESLRLDTLPSTTKEGRRLSRAMYLERLRDWAKQGGKSSGRPLDLRVEETQRSWLDHLTGLGLDAALFLYQVKMNSGEGGASKLFRFATDEEFLEFFLTVVTEPTSLTSMDQSLDELAVKVAKRPRYELELEYGTGVLSNLDALVAAKGRAEAAAKALQEAVRGAQDLRDRIAAARALAEEHVRDARETADREAAKEREHDLRRRRLMDEEAELRRLAAEFRRDEARQHLTLADEAYGAAERRAKAWRQVDRVSAFRVAQAEVEAARAAYDAVEKGTVTLRQARDTAARHFHERLQAEMTVQLDVATQEVTAANQLDRDAERASNEATEALLEARDAQTGRERLQKEIASTRQRRAAAVAAKYLEEFESTADAVARWEEVIRRLDAEIAELRARREALSDELATLEAAIDRQEQERLATLAEIHPVEQAFTAGEQSRRRLISEPRLIELAENQDFDLEIVGPALAHRLQDLVAKTERALVTLEVRGADDQRAVAAIQETGYLPPPLDLEDVVNYLRQRGVTRVTTGWRYIAESTSSIHQARVIARRPDLVSGVILNSQEDLERARALLEEAELDPNLAIVVGTDGELFGAETSGEEHLVVPPALALYDRAAAQAELVRRQQQLEVLETQRQDLRETMRADQALADEIVRHLEAFPRGALAAMAQRLETLRARITGLQADVEQARARKREAATELRDLDARERIIHQERPLCEGRVGELRGLFEAEAAAVQGERQIEELFATELGWNQLAGDAKERATRLRAEARTARDSAADHRAAAQRLERDVAVVPLADRPLEVSPSQARQLLSTLADLDTLRSTAIELDRLLQSKTTGSAAATELQRRIDLRDAVERELRHLETSIQQDAEQLLDLPDGVDPASRRRAAERAEEALRLATEDRLTAGRDHAVAERELEMAAPRDGRGRFVQFPPDRLPSDRLTAERWAAERSREYEREAAARSAAADAAAAARERAIAAEGDATRMRTIVSTLSEVLGSVTTAAVDAPRPAAPFEGDAESAFTRSTGALRDTGHAARRAEDQVRRTLTDLTAFARQERFTGLSGQLHRRLTQDHPDAILRDSPVLLASVHLLVNQLQVEIQTLQQHRGLVVQSLAGLTDQAISHLRVAEKQSRLPAGSGPWADQAFLRIRFEAPGAPSDTVSRLTPLVAALAQMEGQRRPKGSRLLTQAVMASVVGELKVTVLKPNPAGEVVYVPVAEMGTMSGGMRSTAAIALFCTLARLRAHNRSRSRDMGVAVLCLDNPLASANAPYLIDLQLAVAQAAGIQLLYTTGINDFIALRRFSNPIALSNDAARRTMLRYVRGNPKLLEKLAPPPGHLPHVQATRVTRKPS